jgi:hypothetical protein
MRWAKEAIGVHNQLWQILERKETAFLWITWAKILHENAQKNLAHGPDLEGALSMRGKALSAIPGDK